MGRGQKGEILGISKFGGKRVQHLNRMVLLEGEERLVGRNKERAEVDNGLRKSKTMWTVLLGDRLMGEGVEVKEGEMGGDWGLV